MKKFAKFLSILCALALIASCISVGFVASAAEAEWSSSTSLTAPLGSNHFANGKLVVAATDGNKWTISDNTSKLAALTNGVGNEGAQMLSASNTLNTAANNSILSGTSNDTTSAEQTAAFLQVTVDLKGTVSQPESFYYAAHNNGWGGPNGDGGGTYISVHYEIFASDMLYDLYDSSNSLYVHKASSMSGRQHKIDISNLDLPEVKYFGIRFYNRGYANYVIHASELGIFGGTYTASSVTYSESMDKPTDATYSTDNHITSNGTVTYVVDGVASGTGSMQAHYYNGTPDGAYHDFKFAEADNSPFQNDTYMQYEYTLAAPINNPETFFYAAGTGWDNMASQRYTVFASSSKDTLYNDESIVYEYISPYGMKDENNANPQPMEQTLDISDLELKNIKYFAVRFYNRSYGSNYTAGGRMNFISELGLYGGKAVFQANPEPTSDDYATRFGKNRLTNSSYVTIESVDGVTGTPSHAGSAIMVDNLWSTGRCMYQSGNGMNADNNEDGQTDTYFQTTFTLSAPVNDPEKAFIAWANSNGAQPDKVSQESHHYEIFASDKLEDLYTKSIYEHNVSSDLGWEHVIDISNKDLKGIKYFGIRIYHRPPAIWNSIIVVTEIGLYGGEVEKAATITTGFQSYSKGSAYTAYGQNHLEYAIGEAIATNGTDTVAANVALGSVDGKFTDSGTIAAGDGLNINKEAVLTEANNGLDQTAAYLQLQYTLNAPVDNPQKFVFIHHNSVSGSFNSAHYAVFASDSLETLYDKALYEFKADAGVGNTHVIDISEFELQNVKYAAIRLYHRAYNNCNQHIEEFGLYGGTMEAGFNTNSTAAFPNTTWGSNNILKGKAVSAVSDNGSSVVPFEDTDSYLAGFTDDKTANDGTGAKYIDGLETGGSFKVTYDLGGTLNNPTTVNFQAGWGVQKPYTVYASATLEDLYNAENAIVEVAGYTGGIVYRNITTDITEKNLTGIKYIGLKVDATNNTMMHITEFAVKGGTYTEDPKEPEVSVQLGASVFASTAGQNANDITYRLNVTSDSTIVDMGIISGFKVNIDADAGFQPDTKPEEYAEYLKTAPATAVKVSATAEQLTNEKLYFHVTNSGTAGTADYSGYKLVTIAYVTVEFEGEEYTYYSNVIIKSSKQISRNQARDYYNLGGEYKEIADTAFAGYDFTNASTDINKVREYVEAVS